MALIVLIIIGYPTDAENIKISSTSTPEVYIKMLPLVEEFNRPPFKTIYIKKYQPPHREAWLQKLILCESTGNPNAINKIDLDGTSSYGLLQFKPSTFKYFAKKYNVPGEMMNPESQKEVVRHMMDDKSVVWKNQFPDCVRKLGTPPKL